jgi:DNA-binding CsgD family transcriptional regulator
MQRYDLQDARLQLILIGLLLAIVLGGVMDLILDRPTTLWNFHVLFELGFVLLCFGTAVFLWMAGHQSAKTLERTRGALGERQAELEEWRGRTRRFLQGLGAEIDGQLKKWELSPAEREAALFLLKGYSTKEIALHLGKSERTVRQHCSAVYKKSGLAGRAELSAFFLEDLLLPVDEGESTSF